MVSIFVNKFNQTNILIQNEDITRIPTDAILTTINPDWMRFGGVNIAIQRVAKDLYHAQAQQAMPLFNLQTVVAKGNRKYHAGCFNDVVFVVDDLKSPLEKVLYRGLEASHNESYRKILIPAIRMGLMKGVYESPKEVIQKMGESLKRFMDDYSHKTKLEDITFVVNNDAQIQERLINQLN